MHYTVIDIIEADYGCEGIPDNYEAMVTVVLEDALGNRISIKYSDKELYRMNINTGSHVLYSDNELRHLD